MKRERYLECIKKQFKVHAACAILGPRQVGKTTLAQIFVEHEKATFFDLENPRDLAKLDNPMLTLEGLTDQFIVIDEIQMRPDLFPVLRVLIDQHKKRKFLILGSASRDLIKQSSETLAGRIGYIELCPIALFEEHNSQKLWLRGGFPNSYLAQTDEESYLWKQGYIKTFLERDIPALGFDVPPPQLRRFWLMLAHYHGQIFNAHEIGKSLGISNYMIQKYLDILVGTFMIRNLTPWFENIQKRQVKSSKLYFRDSGILHALLGLSTHEQLDNYPRLGSFWEGFALEEVIRILNAAPEECYFWATHSDAELDLFILKDGKRLGFEFKYADAPRITKSMRIARDDLKLDHLFVIYPGNDTFPMDEKISAYGLENISKLKLGNFDLR